MGKEEGAALHLDAPSSRRPGLGKAPAARGKANSHSASEASGGDDEDDEDESDLNKTIGGRIQIPEQEGRRKWRG
jgi:hypothetical protein